MKADTQRKSLSLYFVLAIVISWLSALLAEQFDLPLTTERAQSVGPFIYVAMLTGPFIGGLLSIGLMYGKKGFKDLLRKLTAWKVSWRWYLIVLLATPLLGLIVLLGLSLYSADFIPAIFTAENKLALVMQGIMTGVFVGLFEEIGWTGFAIPQLLKRGASVFKTGLIVGLIWGSWHFIPFWEVDSFQALAPFLLLMARLFTWLIPFRILITFVYSQTKSLLIVILMHTSLVFTTLALPSMSLTGSHLIIWILFWTVVLWGMVGVVNGKKLRN